MAVLDQKPTDSINAPEKEAKNYTPTPPPVTLNPPAPAPAQSKMPTPWRDVERSEFYNNLSFEKKVAVRDRYFDKVIAPRVNPEKKEAYREYFYKKTDIGNTKEADSAITVFGKEAARSALEGAIASPPKYAAVIQTSLERDRPEAQEGMASATIRYFDMVEKNPNLSGMDVRKAMREAGIADYRREPFELRQYRALAADKDNPEAQKEKRAIRQKYIDRIAEARLQLAQIPAAKDRDLYKAGDRLSAGVESRVPLSQASRQESPIASSLGQATGFTGAALVTGVAAGPVGAMGVGMSANAVQGYEDAIQKGATEKQAIESGVLHGFVGASEALPIERFMGIFKPKAAKAVADAGEKVWKRMLRGTGHVTAEGLKQGAAEAAQEIFQTFANEMIASDIVKYDKARGLYEIWDDSKGEWATAFTVGDVMGMAGGLAQKYLESRMRRKTGGGNVTPPPTVEEPIQNLEDFVAQKPGAQPEAAPDAAAAPTQATDAELERVANEPETPVEDIARLDQYMEPLPGEEVVPMNTGEGTETTGFVFVDEQGRIRYPGQAPKNAEGATTKESSTVEEVVQPRTTKAETAEDVALAGAEAASSPLNDLPEPTEAQKEAGNYRKGHVNVQGLDISIETPRGGERSGKGPDGEPWSITMPHDYGYIKRTKGADQEQVDVYIGENPQSDRVFIVDQVDADSRKFDEHKALVGFEGRAEAEAAYLSGFSDGKGRQRMRSVTEMNMDEFKRWLKGAQVKPAAQQAVEPTIPVASRSIRRDTAVMPDNTEVDVEYAVVEANDLISSQLDDLRNNPNYPKELQPRDRTRAASEQQIQRIVNNLNPRLLAEQPLVGEGSPIIAESGVVESGNGRTVALRRAYNEGKASQYRDFLQQQGYPVEGMERPVLVRIRRSEMDMPMRQRFAQASNERTTSGMSATEQAQADATRIDNDLLSMYGGGDVTLGRNRPFVRAFLRETVSQNDMAEMIGSDGSLSKTAINRLEGAMLAKAYGDPVLLENLLESTDDSLRGLGKALIDASPSWARMRAEAAAGEIYPGVDITPELMEAVKVVLQARQNNRNVKEFLGQGDMFSSGINPRAELLIRRFFWNADMTRLRARDKLAGDFQFYADEARKTSAGTNLFGEAPASQDDLLAAMRARDDREDTRGEQGDIFIPTGPNTPKDGGQGSAEREPSSGQEVPQGGYRTLQNATERQGGQLGDLSSLSAKELDSTYNQLEKLYQRAPNEQVQAQLVEIANEIMAREAPKGSEKREGLYRPFDIQVDNSLFPASESEGIEGDFDAKRLGRLLVFQMNDGTVYVVDGHKRLAAAKRAARAGESVTIDALTIRESEGFTVAEGKQMANELNSEGKQKLTEEQPEPATITEEREANATDTKDTTGDREEPSSGAEAAAAVPGEEEGAAEGYTVNEEDGQKVKGKSLSQRAPKASAQPVFYSSLLKAVQSLQQPKAPAQQWATMIRKQPGVKPEEIEWIGLEEWLNEQPGKITREEVEQFITDNQVQVDEVIKSDAGTPPSFEQWARENVAGNPTEADRERYNRYLELGDPVTGEGIGDTKYSSFVLPGGQNYKELLITLPNKYKNSLNRVNEYNEEMLKANREERYADADRIRAERDAYQEKAIGSDYRSSHYEEKNILAHIRFNEREDSNGNRMLFIEEIQSDWHQEGRKKGYKSDIPQKLADRIAKARQAFNNARDTQGALRSEQRRVWNKYVTDNKPKTLNEMAKSLGYEGWTGGLRADDIAKIEDAFNAQPIKPTVARTDFSDLVKAAADIPGYTNVATVEQATEALQQAFGIGDANKIIRGEAELRELRLKQEEIESEAKQYRQGAPDAPFKKNWHELAFKRALRYAAENGFDAIAWTTGKQQADRYGLEKHIDSIIYEEDGALTAYDQNGNTVIGRTVQESDLPNYLGEEVARKLLDAPKNPDGHRYLSGQDLKTGGEGMKGFYDKILPNFASKYVKKWGGNVTSKKISTGEVTKEDARLVEELLDEEPNSRNTGRIKESVHYIEITEDMRNSVKQGQSLFQRPTDQKPKVKPLAKYDLIKRRAARRLSALAREVFGENIDVRFVEKLIDDTNEEITGMLYQPDATVADYFVLVSLGKLNDDPKATLGHEGIHWLRRMGVLEDIWPTLTEKAQSTWIEKYKIRERYHDVTNEELIVEEAIAEAFGDYLSGTLFVPSSINRVFQKVAQFLDRVANFLKGEGFTSWRDAFEEVRTGKRREDSSVPRVRGGVPIPDSLAMAQRPRKDRERDMRGVPFSLPDATLSTLIHEDSLSMIDKIKQANRDVWVATSDAVRRKTQDKFIHWKRVQERIEEQAGRKLEESEQVYLYQEMFTGRAGEKLQQLEVNHVNPLFDIMGKLEGRMGNAIENVEEYLYARHAKERNAQIAKINPQMQEGGSGMSDAEADAIIAKIEKSGEKATFEDIAKRVRKILDNALSQRVEMGLMTKEHADLLRETYKEYVPLRGIEEVSGDFGMKIGKGFEVRGEESKRALGRKSKAKDLLANVFAIADEAIIRGEKNRVFQSLYNLVENNPNQKVWEINRVDNVRVFNKSTGLVEMQPKPVAKGTMPDNETIVGKIDGKQVRIHLYDRRLASAMKNLDIDSTDGAWRALMALNRYLSAANTSFSPEFIISNAFRDMQTAAINLQQYDMKGLAKETAKNYRKALKGAWGGVRGKGDTEWQKYFREFAAAGGRVSFYKMDDLKARQKKLSKEIELRQKGAKNVTKRSLREMLEFVEYANQAVDNAIRLSAFVAARKRGMTEAQAASLAKNLTVNFNKHGEWGAKMNAMYLFYNASVQGTFVLFHAMRSRRVQKIAGGMVAFGFAMDMLNAMLSDEDDDGQLKYDKMGEWEKSANWVLMVNEDEFPYAKIPLAYGYRFFYNIGQSVSAYMRGAKDMPETMENMLRAFVENYNPIGGSENPYVFFSPTISDPFVELAINENFMSRPILPKEDPYDSSPPPDSQRYFKNVSKLSKELTETLNELSGGDEFKAGMIDISPETVDHLFQHYTGAAGAFVGRTVDAAAKIATFSGDELTINDIPFYRKVVGSTPDWMNVTFAYDRMSKVDGVYERVKGIAESGDPQRARKVLTEDKEVFSLYPLAKQTRQILADTRKQKAAIEANDSLAKQERKRLTDELDKVNQNISNRFNKAYLKAVKKDADNTRPFGNTEK